MARVVCVGMGVMIGPKGRVVKGSGMSVPDRLRGNRLAGVISMLAFSVSELLVLAKILPAVLPVGQVLAIETIALIAIYQNLARLGMFGRVSLVWLAVTNSLFLYFGQFRDGWIATLSQFPLMFTMALVFMVLSQLLAKKSVVYMIIFSCVTSGCCLFVGAIVAWSVLDTAVRHLPLVYDPVLYRIDALLWFGKAYRFADLLNAHAAFRQIILVLYKYNLVFALPAILSDAFYTRKSAAELTLQLFFSSFLVFPLFCMMPALAPAFYFGSLFPDHLPLPLTLGLHAVPAPLQTIRNTFPSLHAVWAILIWLALKDSPVWQRVFGFGFLLATLVATLGFGEHYAVDWVAALPLVLLVRGICCTSLPVTAAIRLGTIILGGIILALWVAVVRGVPETLALPWDVRVLGLASVVLPVFAEHWLTRQERRTVSVTHAFLERAYAR
jgi:hypothetical protein